MSVTRLKRKHRKNIARANNETRKIKNLLRTPVLKNVDLDELKSKFSQPAPPDVAAESNKAVPSSSDKAAAVSQKAFTQKVEDLAATEPKAQPEAKEESLFAKVSHAASTAADAVKHAATDAVEAVSHNSVVEKAKELASDTVEAVAHNSLVAKATDAVQEATHSLVEGAKHVLESKSPEENQATEANQTGTTGFDTAEAETKPVTEESQAGEHPKPEIAL